MVDVFESFRQAGRLRTFERAAAAKMKRASAVSAGEPACRKGPLEGTLLPFV